MYPKGLLGQPPGYDLFFAPLKVAIEPGDYERVRFAYIISKYGHRGQVRDGGERYFDHPKAAAWIYVFELGGRDPRVIIDLLLHDISEDAYLLSPYRIKVNFGADIAFDVQSLTKLPKGTETTTEYLRRVIAQGPYAILSKLCDRLHNLRTVSSCSKEKQAAQIHETLQYHLPLLVPALRACGEPWSAYADTLEREILIAIGHLQ